MLEDPRVSNRAAGVRIAEIVVAKRSLLGKSHVVDEKLDRSLRISKIKIMFRYCRIVVVLGLQETHDEESEDEQLEPKYFSERLPRIVLKKIHQNNKNNQILVFLSSKVAQIAPNRIYLRF